MNNAFFAIAIIAGSLNVMAFLYKMFREYISSKRNIGKGLSMGEFILIMCIIDVIALLIALAIVHPWVAIILVILLFML